MSWANKQWLSIKERECTVNLDGESCIELHNAHMSGRRGLTRNENRARGFYDQWRRMRARECSPTSPGLCLQLSRYMLRGIGYFNATQLRSYLETACAGGRSGADGCWLLAQQYLPGGKFRDDPIAAELWSRRACEGGVRDGCVALGDQYRDGVGVAKDLKKAFALYEHTCSASRRTHRNACSRFEEMLYNGKGTKRDRSRFFSEVQTRCYDTGASDACITLAITYRRGIGTKMDRKKSKALIERACSGQRPWGCAVYGEFLEKREVRAPASQRRAQGLSASVRLLAGPGRQLRRGGAPVSDVRGGHTQSQRSPQGAGAGLRQTRQGRVVHGAREAERERQEEGQARPEVSSTEAGRSCSLAHGRPSTPRSRSCCCAVATARPSPARKYTASGQRS